MNPVQSDKNIPLTFFSLPTMVIMNPTNKNSAHPKCSQRLDRRAGHTLQDTAHLWNTWLMIYKKNTVQNTEQAVLLRLVQMLETQDLLHGPVQVSRPKSPSDQLIIHLFHLHFEDIITENNCSCLALLLYCLTNPSMNLSNLHFNSVSTVISQLNVSVENKNQTKQPPSTPIFPLPVSVI